MIGSNIDRMVTAEKMSVQQLQESINNGILPAYIGIPILKEKMEMQAQSQAMQQPPETPIAQEIMSQASGVNQLPSNLPPEGFRDGGIVGYAEGGLFEDDFYESQTEEEEYMDALNNLYTAAMGVSAMSRYPDKTMYSRENVTPNVEPVPQATQQPTAPQAAPQAVPQAAPQQPGGISDLIQGAAGRYNLPADLMQNIAGAESSGRSDAANPRSSAKGIYQFIDSTWEGLGGTPGNQFDAQENVELGAKYIRQNAEKLKNDLGRNPTYAETYAAHYFGPGVAKMLSGADPQDPIEVGLAMFNNPKTVGRILESNPNLQDKTVGEVLASLEKKAGEGIVELAKGGVARFDSGGDTSSPFTRWLQGQKMTSTSINPTGFEQIMPEEYWEAQSEKPANELLKESIIGPFMTQTDEEYAARMSGQRKALEEGMKNPSLVAAQQEVANYPLGFGLGTVGDQVGMFTSDIAEEVSKSDAGKTKEEPPKETPKPTAPEKKSAPAAAPKVTPEQKPVDQKTINVTESMATQATKAPEKSLADIFLERFEKADSNAQKQREMDAYTALATAGFAAAAGTSPNAIQNIAQGALAGMGQYGNLQKQRVEERLAGEKSLLTAQRYQELGEAARATQALTGARLTSEEQNRLDTQMERIKGGYLDNIKASPTLSLNPNAAQAALDQSLVNDAQYNALFKQRYGVDYKTYVGSQRPAPSSQIQVVGKKPS